MNIERIEKRIRCGINQALSKGRSISHHAGWGLIIDGGSRMWRTYAGDMFVWPTAMLAIGISCASANTEDKAVALSLGVTSTMSMSFNQGFSNMKSYSLYVDHKDVGNVTAMFELGRKLRREYDEAKFYVQYQAKV